MQYESKQNSSLQPHCLFQGKCQELIEAESELVVMALGGWAGLCLWAGGDLHLCCPKPWPGGCRACLLSARLCFNDVF